jgi:hypothetical protein
MIKVAKGLKRLRSATAILLLCVCNESVAQDLLDVVLEGEFPGLKILYDVPALFSRTGL